MGDNYNCVYTINDCHYTYNSLSLFSSWTHPLDLLTLSLFFFRFSTPPISIIYIESTEHIENIIVKYSFSHIASVQNIYTYRHINTHTHGHTVNSRVHIALGVESWMSDLLCGVYYLVSFGCWFRDQLAIVCLQAHIYTQRYTHLLLLLLLLLPYWRCGSSLSLSSFHHFKSNIPDCSSASETSTSSPINIVAHQCKRVYFP